VAPDWNIDAGKSPTFPVTGGPMFLPVPLDLACIALIIAICSRLMLCSLGMSSGEIDVAGSCDCSACWTDCCNICCPDCCTGCCETDPALGISENPVRGNTAPMSIPLRAIIIIVLRTPAPLGRGQLATAYFGLSQYCISIANAVEG